MGHLILGVLGNSGVPSFQKLPLITGPTTSTWLHSCSCSSCACCPQSSPLSATGRPHTAAHSGGYSPTLP